MSQASPDTREASPFHLSLSVVLSEECNVLDLSGKVPFKIYVDVWRRYPQSRLHREGRNYSAHSQPVDIVTNGSILDVSSALFAGRLLLVEVQGRYPEQPIKECIRKEVPKELFVDAADDPLLKPPQVARLAPVVLKSGYVLPPWDPQRIECLVDPAISAVLKDDIVYYLKYPSDAYANNKNILWNGGIAWWKLCSDPALTPDLSAPSDKPEPKVRNAQLPLFKAMANPPRPPQIDYELECSPAVISLSDPSIFKISVTFRLREPTAYTVMWRRSGNGPTTTALGSEGIGACMFDVVDIGTREVLSVIPQYGTSQWTHRLPRPRPIKREQLREIKPGQTYKGDSVIDGGKDQLSVFMKFFRLHGADELLDRRLAVKLRPVHAFWAAESIDEFFESKETVKMPYWYIPLTIESPAIAEFRVVP